MSNSPSSSGYEVSQRMTIQQPLEVDCYPVSVQEWELIKERIKSIRDKRSFFLSFAWVLVGLALATFASGVEKYVTRLADVPVASSEVVIWAFFVLCSLCAVFAFVAGHSQKRVREARAEDVVLLMEMIEKRFPEVG